MGNWDVGPSARALAVGALALVALALPGAAQAARSWQLPEAPPAGFDFGGFGGGQPVALDAQGNLLSVLKPASGPFQYAVRPHAGTLGAPQALPSPLGDGAAPTSPSPFAAQNAAGDLLLWKATGDGLDSVVAFRPAAAPSIFGSAQTLSGVGAVKYAAMTPSGASVAETVLGNPKAPNPTSKTFAIFRGVGPAAAFDTANAIEMPPAATDTATEPLGIAIDPDGRVTAVYRSYPSLQVIQISAAGGGGDFEDPAQLTLTEKPEKWQDSAAPKIATSFDGHAILVWGTDRTKVVGYKTELWASRRAPGGTFGPREQVVDLDPTHGESDADTEYGPRGIPGPTANPEYFPVALDSGVTLIAFNETTEGDNCTDPGTEDSKFGSDLAVKNGGAWGVTALGANGNAAYSQVNAVAAAGNSVVLGTTAGFRSAPCSTQGAAVFSGRVGQNGGFGPPEGLGNTGGPLGNGIAVNAAGDAAMAIGSPRVLRVYEDDGAGPSEPEEGGPGPSTPTGGSRGASSDPAPPLPPIAPPVLAPGGIKLDGPLIVDQRGRKAWVTVHVFCTTTAQVSCTITVEGDGSSAKRPFARGDATKRKAAALIQSAATKVAPGKSKELKVYLTDAGKALLKKKPSFTTKIRVSVAAGGKPVATVKPITVKRPQP